MKSASDYPHKFEFVCSQCLASVYSNDDDPVPRCARCLIRMLPDSDKPATYHSALRPLMSRRRVKAPSCRMRSGRHGSAGLPASRAREGMGDATKQLTEVQIAAVRPTHRPT
jgi:hypothetical protein